MQQLPRHVIGVGASAGGVEALRTLVADLPADLDAAVCIVLHIPPSGKSLLAPILARMTPLETVLAEHGAPLRPGVIYVAPADRHLLIRHDVVELSRGPRENGVRPAADPMFRSLAAAWGANGVAVVLSGSLDDGAAGAAAVVEAGGRLLVQEPSDALVPGMPSSAIAVTRPDAVLPIGELGAALGRLVTPTGVPRAAPASPPASRVASGFTCPECAGALWELREGGLVRYACRVGHAYSEEAMVEAQGGAVEAALWRALTALEERGELLERIADRMRVTAPSTEHRFREGAREAGARAATIRRVLAVGSEEVAR